MATTNDGRRQEKRWLFLVEKRVLWLSLGLRQITSRDFPVQLQEENSGRNPSDGSTTMEEFYASLFCVRYWPCSGDSFVGCSVTIDVFLVVKKKIIIPVRLATLFLLDTTG